MSDRSGAVVAGTPEEQTQTSALDCGFAAHGDGGNLLTEAEAMGDQIINAPAESPQGSSTASHATSAPNA